MDFNDWVYNFGGIIGMWFGWSALSITSILMFIKYIFIKIFILIRNKLKYIEDQNLIEDTSSEIIDNNIVIIHDFQQNSDALNSFKNFFQIFKKIVDYPSFFMRRLINLLKYQCNKILFTFRHYWKQRLIIKRSNKISFITINNKQVIVYH